MAAVTGTIGTTINLTVVSQKASVPDVRGKTEDDARQILGQYGFQVNTNTQTSTQPTGTVLAQSPGPNSSADRAFRMRGMGLARGQGLAVIRGVQRRGPLSVARRPQPPGNA